MPSPWITPTARTGPIWIALFCVLQATPWTAALALPALAVGGLWLLAVNALQLHGPSRMDLLLMQGLLVGGGSAAAGLDPQRSLLLAVPTVVFVLIYVLLTRTAQFDWRWLHLGILLAGGLQMLQLWMGWLLHPAMPAGELLQLLAIPWLVVPNDWVWISCLAPICLQALGASRTVMIVLLLTVALTAVVLQSRLALLCLLLALWPALRTQQWRIAAAGRWKLVVLIVGLLLTVLAVALWHKGANSMWSRLQLWQAALGVWLEYPWLGVGPHNFVLAYADALTAAPIDPRLTPWPHSLPLELLAEWGVLGTAAVLMILAWAWRCYRSLANRSGLKPALSGLVLALSPALVLEASLLRTWLWFMLALLLAGSQQQSTTDRLD